MNVDFPRLISAVTQLLTAVFAVCMALGIVHADATNVAGALTVSAVAGGIKDAIVGRNGH